MGPDPLDFRKVKRLALSHTMPQEALLFEISKVNRKPTNKAGIFVAVKIRETPDLMS